MKLIAISRVKNIRILKILMEDKLGGRWF